jgi:hypothetical protein
MVDYLIILKFKYFICFLIYILEKFIYKYFICEDIIKKKLNINKYDNYHTLYILYLIFNIEIHTIQYLQKRFIQIFYNKKLISNICIENENNITNKNKIILSFLFLDQYYFTNLLQIYNCGIFYHSNNLFTHIYNYSGERRIDKSIIEYKNI